MMQCSLLSLGCVFGCAPSYNQTGLTALKALKIAQRRLRPEVRAKLVSVSSARSDDSLTPQAWRFVFVDPNTSGNSRVVTVAAKASSEHPETVEAFAGFKNEAAAVGSHAIAQNKLLVDSNQALLQSRGAAKLRGITAAEYRLTQSRNGQEPLWTLTLFGEAERDPVVRFQVGAKSGFVKMLSENN
jgi:hypothetical protein